MLATCQLSASFCYHVEFQEVYHQKQENGRFVARSRHGMCESGFNTAGERHGMCESGINTAGGRHGMYESGFNTAGERHGMCESAFRETRAANNPTAASPVALLSRPTGAYKPTEQTTWCL